MNICHTATVLAAITALVVDSHASGHEMFLKPEKSVISVQSNPVVRLVNGTFDKSENSIPRDRLQNVSIVADGRVKRLPERAWYDDAKKTASS